MDTIYLSYLKLVLFIAAGAVLLSLLLFFTARERKKGRKKAAGLSSESGINSTQTRVDIGNVSILFDKRRNVVLIPYVTDKYRSGRATTDIIWLDMPYNSVALGKAVRSAMASCKKGKPAVNAELMSRLGARDWKEFTEGKRSVSIYCKDSKMILMNSTVRIPDGAYLFTTRGYEVCLPAVSDDGFIGDAVLELLTKCR